MVLQRATQLATRLHEGQTRKDGKTPYITHPIRVMRTLERLGVTDEELLAAAVLHDVVEDCAGGTEQGQADLLQQLTLDFGPRIAGLVGELTKAPKGTQTRRDYDTSWSHKSVDACLIKLADRFDNLNDWAGMDPAFKAPYLRETRRMLEAMDANPAVHGAELHEAHTYLFGQLAAMSTAGKT